MAKTNRQKDIPSATPAAAPSNQAVEVDPSELAAFILELLHNEELIDEFNKYRHDPKSYDVRAARTATGEAISQMFTVPLNDRLRGFIERLRLIDSKSDRVLRLLEQLVDARFRVEQVVFDGEAKHRYLTEFPAEKRAIAEHVAETCFKAPAHCFFQASTTAFHLVEVLLNGGFGRGNVLHTNSFAVPYMLLGKGTDHARRFSVYTICGDVKDQLCDGWLYTARDENADKYVRSLFERGEQPIKKAFVTPQFVDANGVCYFAREETVPLIDAVLDMAEEIVVLTPGPRILADRNSLRAAHPEVSWNEVALRRTSRTKSIQWVVGGTVSRLDKGARELFQATRDRLKSSAEWIEIAAP